MSRQRNKQWSYRLALAHAGRGALVLTAAALAAAAGRATEPPEEPEVEQHQVGKFHITDFQVPGEIHAWSEAHRPEGTQIYLLMGREAVEQEDETSISIGGGGVDVEHETRSQAPAWESPQEQEELRLYRISQDRDTIEEVPFDSRPDLDSLYTADLDSDGFDEILLASDDDVFELTGNRLQRRSGLRREHLRGRATTLDSASRSLVIPEFGNLAIGWKSGQSLPLPRRAERIRTGIRLTSPEATLSVQEGDLVALVGPESSGSRRFKTTIVREEGEAIEDPDPSDPSDPSDPEASNEAWGLLPAPETIEDSLYLRQDGELRVAVFTQSAEKLGVFERRRLRIFPLETRRTRAGTPPILEHQTASYRWQEPSLLMRDLNGDAQQDLLVLEPDGLASGKLQMRIFFGNGGGFSAQSPRAKMERPSDNALLLNDFTGNGSPELAVPHAGHLLIWEIAPRGSRALEKEPTYVLLQPGRDSKPARKIARMRGAQTLPTGPLSRPRRLANERELLFLDSDEGSSQVRVLRFAAPEATAP